MRVMVTGAASPLGRALVRALVDDSRVEALLAVANEPAWDGCASAKLTCLSADLLRSRELRRVLFGPAKELTIEAVVHLPSHPTETYQGHVDATRELLHLAERHPTLRRFVYRSFAEMYRVRAAGGGIIGEEHPLDFSVPPGVRARAEADLTVCTRMGMAPSLSITVLRFAELLAPDCGSQLYDYLSSRVCFRPLGFDPMMQLISLEDAVRALVLALFTEGQGIFNVPGADVLPLSRAIELAGRRGIAVPGPFIGPLYRARALARGTEFRYQPNRFRFHYSAVLDGRRAQAGLGYSPAHLIRWAELFGEAFRGTCDSS